MEALTEIERFLFEVDRCFCDGSGDGSGDGIKAFCGEAVYRDKLPKFRNMGPDGQRHMVFNWMEWRRDGKGIPKIHPTQKPVNLLKRLIEVFTDPGDVVIDPCAGSGSTLRAAYELDRHSYGFEVDKQFYMAAREKMIATFFEPPAQLGMEVTT